MIPPSIAKRLKPSVLTPPAGLIIAADEVIE